jgi:hypothetical protein
MPAYLSHFFSGEVDPTWPHAILLTVTVLASFAVAAGIIFESPEYSASVHRVATWCVIVGVAIEAVCTITLFVFDEGISSAQQSKIIALETRLAPRVLTSEQFEEFKKLRGSVPAVSLMNSPQLEPSMFGAQMAEALNDAGVAITPYFARSGDIFMGTRVCLPIRAIRGNGDTSSDALLFSTLAKATGSEPAKCSFDEFGRPVRRDVPLIIVGERPFFSPDGNPVSVRFRAYPDAEKTVETP